MKAAKTTSLHTLATTLEIGGRTLARNTVLNLAGQVVPLVVAVSAMSYVIHHLGPDRFGILSLAWMVAGYFAFFDLGIGPATTKFVAELLGKGEIEKLPALVWTALINQLCFGLLAGVLLAVASPAIVEHLLKIPSGLHAEARLVFLILAVSLPIGFASGSLQGVLAASQRFDLLNAVSVASSSLIYLLPVPALALGLGVPAIVLLFLVIARLATLAILLFLCFRLYPELRRGIAFRGSLVGPLLGYGGWVAVSSAVGPILVYFDRFLIGAVISVAAVGFYTPAYMISTKLGILPSCLAATLFPAFSTSAGRGDREWITNAFVRSLKYLLLVAGPAALVLVFFARPILTLWLGPRFGTEGALVLQILAVGVLINSLAYVSYHLLQGVGRPDVTAKLHLLELPLHVAVAWFLVSRLGLPGAALAWTIRQSLDFLLIIVAACWLTRTPARVLVNKDLQRGVATLTALAAGLFVVWTSTHRLVTDTFLALILTSGFLVATWHYVLDIKEKWHIKLWLKAAR